MLETKRAVFFVALFTSLCTACANDTEDGVDVQQSEYTTCFLGFGPAVTGEIERKYRSLGGCTSFLGIIVDGVRPTPDGEGRFAVFANGSIYWRRDVGAHVVRGEIRELWKAFNWEAGPLGYPLTDETLTPDGRGRFNVFEGGSVYWTRRTGAHEVRGAIRDKWKELGWEAGPLGYPTSGELEIPGGMRSNFEGGSIKWIRSTGQVDVTFTD